jgi:hypothetical protein
MDNVSTGLDCKSILQVMQETPEAAAVLIDMIAEIDDADENGMKAVRELHASNTVTACHGSKIRNAGPDTALDCIRPDFQGASLSRLALFIAGCRWRGQQALPPGVLASVILPALPVTFDALC